MKALGCLWPDESVHAQMLWLDRQNELVELGSQSLNQGMSTADKADIIAAREEFLTDMSAIATRSLGVYKRRNRTLTPLSTVIESQRFLHKSGLKANLVINRHPALLAFNADHLRRKTRIVYAATRAWGLPDYRSEANRLMEYVPSIFSLASAKLRTLIRVGTHVAKYPSTVDVQKAIKGIAGYSLESVVVGYLEHRDEIVGPADLKAKVKLYAGEAPEDLRQIYIAQHIGDPIVRTYVRGYPLPEPSAT